MSKNHMEEVAKMLGVELGEAFKISDDREYLKWQRYYRLTSDGVEVSNDNVHWEKCMSEVLEWLLKGEIGIKLPWKPKINEAYYIPFIPCIRPASEEHRWKDTEAEKKYYDMGLVFKTGEEAVELARRMLAVAKAGKNNG